jgi:hypothetical protein
MLLAGDTQHARDFGKALATQALAAQGATRDDHVQSNDGLVLHLVAPDATDPEIDSFLDPHYIWLDPEQADNSKLWVFLPSAEATPADFQLIGSAVAHLGYHVINLMYPNGDVIAVVCNRLRDVQQRESCYENIRLQTLDGIARSTFTTVNPPNSIYNRLEKLLLYLASSFPEEGWKQFLDESSPRWSRIAIGGHSQGGGTAALIGKLHRVRRVIMISSPPEGCVDPECGAARWATIGATPARRYYGLAHQRELPHQAIIANWNAFGLDAFGGPVAPEQGTPPYDCSHILVTDLPPAAGGNYHQSTARDTATPLLPDGSPSLADAWRYISGSSSDWRLQCSGMPVTDAGLED